MCQAQVWVVREGVEEEIMRDVILVERTPAGVRLHTFFEEPRTLAADILSVDLLKHTVRLQAKEDA